MDFYNVVGITYTVFFFEPFKRFRFPRLAFEHVVLTPNLTAMHVPARTDFIRLQKNAYTYLLAVSHADNRKAV